MSHPRETASREDFGRDACVCIGVFLCMCVFGEIQIDCEKTHKVSLLSGLHFVPSGLLRRVRIELQIALSTV